MTITPDQATLAGSITGWDTITVAAQHVKLAFVCIADDDLGIRRTTS